METRLPTHNQRCVKLRDLPRQALAPLGTAFSAMSAKLSAAAKEVGKHFLAVFFSTWTFLDILAQLAC